MLKWREICRYTAPGSGRSFGEYRRWLADTGERHYGRYALWPSKATTIDLVQASSSPEGGQATFGEGSSTLTTSPIRDTRKAAVFRVIQLDLFQSGEVAVGESV